jgi:hypothetical protein
VADSILVPSPADAFAHSLASHWTRRGIVAGDETWVGGVPSDVRSETVSITSGSAAITAAAGTFETWDEGALITGSNIPFGTRILSVTSDTAATMSANATATVGPIAVDLYLHGVQQAFSAGEAYLTPCPSGDFEVVALASRSATIGGRMIGPMILDASGNGVQASWYDAPASYLTLKVSAWGYGSAFQQGPTTSMPSSTTALRLRKSGTNYYTSYSTDYGATWSSETPALAHATFTPTQMGFGSILGAAQTVKLHEFYPAVSTGATSVNLGVVSETTTAHALTAKVGAVKALGVVAEATTVHPLTVDVADGSATVNLGLVSETSTVHPLTVIGAGGESVALGLVSETTTVHPLSVDLGYYVGDATNRVGGRQRGGYAVATWEPAVVTPPASVVYGEARDVAHAYGPVTMNGTQPVFDVDKASRTRHRTRVVVGGKDVTFFRGVSTPTPAYQLVSPLLYGPATLRLPQVAAAFEQLGTGDLDWLRTEQRVLVQRVDEAGDVVATDYRGVIVAFDTAGADLTVEIGGEASGRAALMERQPPIFRTVNDIGAHAYYAIRALGLPFTPRLGPDTGIKLARFGGTGHLDYISQLCARAWTQSGNQWTIMPSTDTGAYRMVRKDTTTIDATAYLDDAYTVGSLRRDLAEEPNRLYATGVTPEGQRVRFGAYPGLKQGTAAPYPFNDNRNFGLGTTNADTDTGDGVTVMIDKLRVHKYMDAIDQPGGYDADAEKGVRQLQNDAGLPVTGTMTPASWRALFDLDKVGFSLRQSQIMPAAQKTYTKQWHRSGAGAQLRKNPNYDKRRLKRDRTVDLGSGFTISQMREFARAEIDASTDDNWVGQIVFHTGALVAGDHTPGTPVAPSDIFRARALRPGMNLSLPLFDGGIVVHVSAVSVGEDGTVTATVDTRARDSMAVWEVIQRNRESRRNPARQWVRDHRASGEIKDAIDGWDEVGGLLGDNVTVPGHRWTIFEVVAGQEGTVARLRLRTNPNAEFVCAVFGRVFDTDAMEKRLTRRVGNPLTEAGSKKWEDEDVRDDLDDNNFLLYVAGSNEDPCGYYPKHKTDGETTNPLTGRWKDDAQFGYRTFAQPVLYVAMYADRDTVVPAGRIMWPQLEAGA